MLSGTLTMARPKRNDAITKIDADLLRKARVVANHRDTPLAQYLTDAAKAVVERDYRKLIEGEHQRLQDD